MDIKAELEAAVSRIHAKEIEEESKDEKTQKKPEEVDFKVGDFVEVYKDWDPDYDPTHCGYVDEQKIGDVFKIKEVSKDHNYKGHKSGNWLPAHILRLSERTENECPHNHDFGSDFNDYDECADCDKAAECEDAAIEEYDGCPIGEHHGEYGDHDYCEYCRNRKSCEEKQEEESDDYKCPKCGYVISSVTVSISGTRTYSISKSGKKFQVECCDDEDIDDENDWCCPECGKDIEDWKE